MPTPTPYQIRRLMKAAQEAVESVGPGLVQRQIRGVRVERKGEGDFVTAADRQAEKVLRARLLEQFPDHGFLGEESGAKDVDADYVWVVDPIDGTSNFAQGLPHWAVSVACLYRGRPVAAAIWAQPDGLVYAAGRGLGARRGRRKIAAQNARLDDAGVIGVQWFRGTFDTEWLRPVFEAGARIRVLGATVTQLCDVARGVLHANIQAQGRLWDFAAAALVATEAGARFTDWSGRSIFPIRDLLEERHYPSITAPAKAHRQLVELVSLPN